MVVADVPVAVVRAAAVAMAAAVVVVEDVPAIVAAAVAVNLPIVHRVPKLQWSWPLLRR